jgi:hypothetical protein
VNLNGDLTMRVLRNLAKNAIEATWLVKFRCHSFFLPTFLRHSKKVIAFNLDLHISVIADVSEQLLSKRFKLIRWSISSHNFVFRKVFRIPDPVEFINQASWRNLSPTLIEGFNEKYGKILHEVDFFVVTHTPSFVQIYERYQKPILCINSTRYEAPYSNNLDLWRGLNDSMKRGFELGDLTIWSNNKVDQSYLSKIVGIESELVPSLCAYVGCEWKPENRILIFIAKTDAEQVFLRKKLGDKWVSAQEGLGKNYKYEKLASVSAVFFLPYQLSTMSLFELATMGVPVIVPSPAFLKELRSENLPILSELLYAPADVLRNSLQSQEVQMDWLTDLDWWLDRADFYDAYLMPNVIVVNSFEEVIHMQFPKCSQEWIDKITHRNLTLQKNREVHFKRFLNKAGLSLS